MPYLNINNENKTIQNKKSNKQNKTNTSLFTCEISQTPPIL